MRVWITGERKASLNFCVESLSQTNCFDTRVKELLLFAILKETGNRNGEGTCYMNLRTVFQSLGEYGKSKEYLEKALAIMKETGDRKGEGTCYVNLHGNSVSFTWRLW